VLYNENKKLDIRGIIIVHLLQLQ